MSKSAFVHVLSRDILVVSIIPLIFCGGVVGMLAIVGWGAIIEYNSENDIEYDPLLVSTVEIILYSWPVFLIILAILFGLTLALEPKKKKKDKGVLPKGWSDKIE